MNVRKGVKWNDGSDFTAEDVTRNIIGWADKSIEGNSMAGRFAALIDADTEKAIDGSVEVVDSHTVKLNLPACDISLIAEVDGIKPYADKRVRQAIATAVDPAVVLELGYANRGVKARNCTAVAGVGPEPAGSRPA